MRILHVWDQGGTASVLAKWQKKIGHEAVVIKNLKHDATGITAFYGGKLVKNKYVFVLKAVAMAKDFDIIHLHDAWFMVAPIKFFYPRKKIVMHYHGSIIRKKMKESIRAKNEKLVNLILVSTPDLLEFDYQKQPYYLPNPVDTELFPQTNRYLRPNNNRCFTSLKADNDPEKYREMMAGHGFDVEMELQENQKGYVKSISYKDFPKKLSQYEYYADIPIQDGKIIKAHSMCGLQALSMGLKVIRWDFTLEESLPKYHRPENVVAQLDKCYNIL